LHFYSRDFSIDKTSAQGLALARFVYARLSGLACQFYSNHVTAPVCAAGAVGASGRKGENAVQDSQQHELIQKLDQLSEQIREREHEETRAKINELFQRVKMPGQNDNGAWIKST
jgi:hypothetical protein